MTPNERALAEVAASVLGPVQARLMEQGAAVADGLGAIQRLLIIAAPPPPPPLPPPAPTYVLIPSAQAIDEGESVTITLRTSGLAAGAQVLYTVGGSVDASDIAGPMSGAFTIDDQGVAVATITARSDALTEGDEFVRLTLERDLASVVVAIRDTSLTTPPPPPPVPQDAIQQRAMNPAALLMPRALLLDQTTYERFQTPAIADGDTWVYEARALSGNVLRPWRAQPYTLLVDGVEHGSSAPKPGDGSCSITVRLGELSHGWHQLDLRGAPDETCAPAFLYVRKPGGEPPALMPVALGSHDFQHNGGLMVYQWAWVPARFEPTLLPLPKVDRKPVAKPLLRPSLYMEELVPFKRSDLYRPRATDGVVHACNVQNYLATRMTSPLTASDAALLDGPRGMGSTSAITFLQVGRNGGVYFLEPWRFGHIDPDGTVRTIAGKRSRQPAPRHVPSRDDDHEMVGDWSAIPLARRGFHEAWDMTWWTPTLATDEAAEPIPNGSNGPEKPHLRGPVCFITDTQRGRVLRLEFDRASHATPVKITEFITGLSDPWGAACVGDRLFISERLANRIVEYDAATGAFVGTLRAGPTGLAFAALAQDRQPFRRQPLEAVRAQGCVLPEKLRHHDGHLYWSSLVMQQVRRINLASNEETVVVDIPESCLSGGYYITFAVSDGSFWPAGTVALQAWSSGTSNGLPWVWLPDGTPLAYNTAGGQGPGMVWTDFSYGGAVDIAQGCMVFSSSLEGVGRIREAQGERTWPWASAYLPAMTRWRKLGLHLTHGPGGFGYYGLPLPWGVHADTDTYLEMHGHVRPA